MTTYMSKTAVITGGSTGIGASFARWFAKEGASLVLVARDRGRLEQIATELRRGGSKVLVVAEDLSERGSALRVKAAVAAAGLSVDVLVNNAGFATYGRFDTVSVDTQRNEIDLNVAALVELTHVFLPELLERRGSVVNVASTAAFQPVPYMAVYGATKAFVLSFSEALWAEYRTLGLRVLALCPGATDTPFFDRVGAAEAALGKKAPPEEVVKVAMRALARGRSHVIHGFGNYLTAQTARLVPRETTARITASLMRPRRSDG